MRVLCYMLPGLSRCTLVLDRRDWSTWRVINLPLRSYIRSSDFTYGACVTCGAWSVCLHSHVRLATQPSYIRYTSGRTECRDIDVKLAVQCWISTTTIEQNDYYSALQIKYNWTLETETVTMTATSCQFELIRQWLHHRSPRGTTTTRAAAVLLSTTPGQFVVRFRLLLFACCYRCYCRYFSVIIITLD